MDINWREEETQEEFAVLDRAGRVQIPWKLLVEIGNSGNKVKLEASSPAYAPSVMRADVRLNHHTVHLSDTHIIKIKL